MSDQSDRIAKARRALLARIHRTYETTDDVIAVGPLRVPFTRVKNPDRVLDMVAENIDRRERKTGIRVDEVQHLPYWAELWDSAYGASQRIVDRSTGWGMRKQNVLDLGCGMGLTGTVAAALGAKVMLADLEQAALLFAQLNTVRYGSRTRQLNWQTDRLGETFDLIVGADILYDKTQWEFLDAFFRAHLAKAGVVLLGEPGRQTGDLFVDWIVGRGWSLDRIEVKIPIRDRPIRIFELHL